MVWASLGLAAGLILVNAVYVAAEFGVVGVRRSRVRQLSSEGSRLARWLLPAIDTPRDLDRAISACQIGITLSGLLLGSVAQSRLAPPLAWALQAGPVSPSLAEGLATAIVLLAVTGASTVFAELVPKAVALRYPTETALYTAIPLMPSRWVYRPFIAFLNGTAALLLRAVGARHLPSRHVHSPQEIALLVAESRDGGALEPDEFRRLQRALRLTQKTARHLMVPRTQIESVDAATPAARLLDIVTASPYSRLPVHRGNVDNIVGLLRTRDVARAFAGSGVAPAIDALIRPVATVPESATVDALLRVLRGQRAHVAIVVDEHGGTEGLVTLDDVLVELLGEVGDEFKTADPAPEELGDGRWRLAGSVSVTDAAVLLDTELESEAATVGGLVVEALGHLPVPGETVETAGYRWRVERLSGRAVDSVVASRLAPPDGDVR
ncbi:MAG: hemolysin family protein [Vicinamibacterales bacterium]